MTVSDSCCSNIYFNFILHLMSRSLLSFCYFQVFRLKFLMHFWSPPWQTFIWRERGKLRAISVTIDASVTDIRVRVEAQTSLRGCWISWHVVWQRQLCNITSILIPQRDCNSFLPLLQITFILLASTLDIFHLRIPEPVHEDLKCCCIIVEHVIFFFINITIPLLLLSQLS
jgi:hypothetical protein